MTIGKPHALHLVRLTGQPGSLDLAELAPINAIQATQQNVQLIAPFGFPGTVQVADSHCTHEPTNIPYEKSTIPHNA